MEQLMADIGKALIMALVLPALTPLLQIIDVNRKRANIKRKLDNIKMMMEMDALLYGDKAEERRAFYSKEYEQILALSGEFVSYTHHSAGKKADDGAIDPFDLGDIFSALAIPFMLFFILVSESEGAEQIEFALVTIFTGAISLAFSKWVICKKVRSGTTQKVLAFAVSVFALLPAMIIVLPFFE